MFVHFFLKMFGVKQGWEEMNLFSTVDTLCLLHDTHHWCFQGRIEPIARDAFILPAVGSPLGKVVGFSLQTRVNVVGVATFGSRTFEIVKLERFVIKDAPDPIGLYTHPETQGSMEGGSGSSNNGSFDEKKL